MLRFLRNRGKEKAKRAAEKTRAAWFGRMASLFRGSHLDEDLWEQVEEILISADVGVDASLRMVERLKQRVRDEGVDRSDEALDLLKQEMVETLTVDRALERMDAEEAPLVITMVGVNGVGKTTSIAKLAHMYQQEGKRVVLGAADTFRAAAIEQLQAWGQRIDVEVIAHQPGADPAAVAYDTLQAALARDADVVIIDTAGRLHTKINLMQEIKKVQRVLQRKEARGTRKVLLAMDATTGQNGLFQARAFSQALRCDGVFLAKLDGTAKGGVVVAITDELKLPVLYIGTGEQPDDVVFFDPQVFVDALFDTGEKG